MTHREAIKEFLSALILHNKTIIDWGSGSKPVSRYIEHENCKFITIDKNELIAQDRRSLKHYIHDIQKPIELGQADIAFCIEVLEHTTNPINILLNIYNNLKDDGNLYLTVPFMFPIHSDDDYLRYTSNGLEKLLNEVGFSVQMIKETVGDQGYIVKALK